MGFHPIKTWSRKWLEAKITCKSSERNGVMVLGWKEKKRVQTVSAWLDVCILFAIDRSYQKRKRNRAISAWWSLQDGRLLKPRFVCMPHAQCDFREGLRTRALTREPIASPQSGKKPTRCYAGGGPEAQLISRPSLSRLHW